MGPREGRPAWTVIISACKPWQRRPAQPQHVGFGLAGTMTEQTWNNIRGHRRPKGLMDRRV
eukprot:6882244-Pyramimonas_sp.AAC.1